jgi:DnaJ-domain-containing protein 1
VHETLRDYASALADLDAAVALDASSIDALLQRAGVHRAAGDLERCFLDVRAARILVPQVSTKRVRIASPAADACAQRPGVVQAEQVAAQAALRRGVRAPSSAARQGPPGGTDACNLPRSYQVLGVGMSATQRDFTRQYRKLASKWHPDKWATATPEEQKVAEHRFRVIADAYETLRDPERRAKHDRDFYFTART